MPEKKFQVRLRNKIDTIANWIQNDPVLLDGELAFSVENNGETIRLKVGNGVSRFSQLPYIGTGASVSPTGTSTDFISYITIDGTEYRIKGSELVVNDGKLIIKKNNNDIGTEFTANSSSNVTVNLGLATVATSGNYNDLSSVPTNVSHFTNDAGYLVSSDINGKADKVTGATNGDLAGLDTNGNLTDSGIVGTDVVEAVEKMHTHSNKAILDATTASFTDQNYVHTDNNFTDEDVEKLNGIEVGAEVNVQPDWDQTDSSADDYIKNKPNIVKNVRGTFVAGITQIEVPFKASEFGDYPLLRAYNNWSLELIGETSYINYSDTYGNDRKAIMKFYSNGSQVNVQENGFYVLGA